MRGCVFMLVTIAPALSAQWLNYHSASTPRTADGKPNLNAPTPRAPDGKPDLSGVWHVEPTPAAELTKMFGDNSGLSVPGDDFYSLSKYTIDVFADFLRKVRRDKIAFRKLNLPNPRQVPVGPGAVIDDDIGFSRSS